MKNEITIKEGTHDDGMGGTFNNNSEAATRKANELWETIDETHTRLIAAIGKAKIRDILERNSNGQSASRCHSASDDKLSAIDDRTALRRIERFANL